MRLKHLHATFISLKLKQFESVSTSEIVASLRPGESNCLKVKIDGTIMEGNHRIHVLRQRGVDVDSLPRELMAELEPE